MTDNLSSGAPNHRGINTVATHNGVFHADDVLAVAALKILAPHAEIIRTRDEGALARADVVVDVGAVYDPERGRFDHHQKSRAGARPNGVLFSSFGLVWRHYGQAVVAAALEGRPLSHETAARVADAVDAQLVCAIDAIDNGQTLFEGGKPAFEGVSGVSLSSTIAGFNPAWWETAVVDDRFELALAFAGGVIRRAIASAFGEILAENFVEEAIAASVYDGNPKIVVLERFVPWASLVRDRAPQALFVVFPSEVGTWMVQAINADPSRPFESRRLLPEAWAGLRDAAFCEAVGLADGIFCHPGRFIAGAKTRESALRLAEMALL